MCGIAGLLGVPPEIARPAAARMLRALGHRGPDARAVAAVDGPPGTPPAILVHTRLAIVDRAARSDQPMAEPAADHPHANWLTYNGEVYNAPDLRAELAAAGVAGRTKSDTEVILLGYRAWGPDAVARMRGMFAWCLLDPAAGRAWLCRDRLGIKPLYLARPPGGGLIFASEVRALLACGPDLVPARANPEAVEGLLAQGYVPGLRTVVDGVTLTAPGESVFADWHGRVAGRKTYWAAPFRPPGGATPDRPAAVGGLRDELGRAVRLRVPAEVPVGVFLSAGMDSSAVAALAGPASADPLRTLTLGFDGPGPDESAEAAGFARRLNTAHTEVRLTDPEVPATFDAFLAATDHPTMDGLNTYLVARAARQAGLVVVLSGLGGDELFGGYATFRDVPRTGVLARAGGRLAAAAGRAIAHLPRRSARKLAELLSRPGELVHQYLLRKEIFLPVARRRFLPLPAGSDPWSGLPADFLDELRARCGRLDTRNAVSSLEVHSYMQGMLLRDADGFSMAHAIELRVPLIDHRVVEATAGLPGRWKVPGKPLLADAVGPVLTDAIRRRKKTGFGLPLARWLRGPLHEVVRAVVHDRPTWQQLGVDPAAPPGVLASFDAGDPDITPYHLCAVVSLGSFAARHRLALA